MQKLNLLELAVIHSALEKYQVWLADIVNSPDNKSYKTQIEGDILTTKQLLPKIKQEYLSQGGPKEGL